MSLSRLGANCQVCPFVDTCDNKEMEAIGFLPLPSQHRPAMSMEEHRLRSLGILNDEIRINTDELVRTIARDIQLPEEVLSRALTSTENEEQWQKFLEINGMR